MCANTCAAPRPPLNAALGSLGSPPPQFRGHAAWKPVACTTRVPYSFVSHACFFFAGRCACVVTAACTLASHWLRALASSCTFAYVRVQDACALLDSRSLRPSVMAPTPALHSTNCGARPPWVTSHGVPHFCFCSCVLRPCSVRRVRLAASLHSPLRCALQAASPSAFLPVLPKFITAARAPWQQHSRGVCWGASAVAEARAQYSAPDGEASDSESDRLEVVEPVAAEVDESLLLRNCDLSESTVRVRALSVV